MEWRAMVLLSGLVAGGCSSEGTLVVQVRTDLIPGAELARVEVA